MAGATTVGAAGVSGLSALSAMNPYTAALSAAVPIAQGIYGIAQKAKANKLRKQFDQPMYAIPGAIDEATGLAQSLAYDPSLPGQSLIEAGLDRGLATGNRAIMEAGMSGAERLAAINAGVGNRLDANTNLAMQMAQRQQQNMQNYQNALNTVAGYQDKQWQLNEQQPWKDAMEAANRLDEAGAQNMMTALKDVTGVGAAAITKGQSPTISGGGTSGFAGNGQVAGPPTYEDWSAQLGITTPLQSRTPSLMTQAPQMTIQNPDAMTEAVNAAMMYNAKTRGARDQVINNLGGVRSITPSLMTQPSYQAVPIQQNATGLDFLSQLGGQIMGIK